MTREEVYDLMENELRCVQRGNYCDRDCAKCPLVKDDKELIEAYGYVIKALEQEPCEDVMVIHTQGLDEGIRCAMCTNSMKSDRSCDGGCVINEAMYKEVMNTIRNHIVPPITPIHKKGKWINRSSTSGCGIRFVASECSCCNKKTFFDCDQLVYKYCPNCGAEMEVEE